MGDFVHLHLHSEYSLLDGACRIADIPKAAKAAGHNAVAITDHGVMYGVVAFYKACKAEGIKPIIGCEVYVARRSRTDREREYDAGSFHLILLVKNETGWKNLITLVSRGFTEGFYSKPRIDLELLEKHADGLVCLSGCLAGAIPRYIVAGEYQKAEEYARRLEAMFGHGNFYLELQNHGLRDDDIVCAGIRSLAEKTGIPMAATNDVHYLKKADAEIQSVLLCIQTNHVITEGKPIGFETDEFYYKNTVEMERLFADYPEACANTQKIADMCQFDFTFGETKLPRYHPENGMAPEAFLRMLAQDGLEKKASDGHIVFTERYSRQIYEERIAYELSVIEKMGYSEYYLIVWDFVHHAKSIGIPVGPGRGSGAGSIVAYLIGITDIDSIRFDLLFERFLNPERVSMPDFDIDFCYDRRDEAIAYVREKYGDDHTAQIVTFGTLAARAAVRDVGRALGMPYSDVDVVARQIPQVLGMTLRKALENEALHTLYREDPQVQKLLDMAMALEGMPRHASTHAAGVVITENPITDYVPVAVNNDVMVTQFDMDTIAELGLLKFDFLALRYLTIIDHAEKQIRETKPSFDLTKVDTNDAATYEAISAGRCDGVFQLESAGMRQMLTQLKPQTLDDIIAAIALYRPGPMDSIPKYIAARHDPSKITYCTPKLAPILDVTYGCIVYQEQVMQIFREIAGYSFGHADVVRRAISKKKQSVLDGEREAFLAGAAERGLDEKAAVDLFEDIVSFANYAFNKSHAAAYAVLSFRTAYLKTHYPQEYTSALLTSVLSSTEKLSEYMAGCTKQGIPILPPDINRSYGSFHVDGTGIRFGLTALKSVGSHLIDQILQERENGGAFRDIHDFLYRTGSIDMNKRQLEVLIKSGTLDSLGTPRSQLLAVYEGMMDNRGSTKSVDDGQIGLFDTGVQLEEPKPVRMEFPQIPEFTGRQKLALEKESCGMYFTGHVLDDYKRHLAKIKPARMADIRASFREEEETADESPDRMQPEKEAVVRYTDKSRVQVAGSVTKIVHKTTKNGDPMAFVTLEDRTSSIEMLCFPRQMNSFGPLLMQDAVLAVQGTLRAREDEDVKLVAETVLPLLPDQEYEKVAESDVDNKATAENTPKPGPAFIRKVYLRVPDETCEAFLRAKAVCGIFEGTVPVTFYSAEKKEYLAPPVRVNPTDFVLGELTELLGKENVVVKMG